ncbi:MAG: hypothetical protein GX279_13675 [Clostridiaceae bacterium]|nr:hypothetical protein [Clostridiaceae bacterium]
MCLLLLAAGHVLVPADKHKKTYLILTFIGLLFRIAVVMYLYAQGVDTVGTDGLSYHMAGIWISNQLDQGVPLFKVQYVYTLYTVVVGLVYHIFGINRYFVSYINIALTFFSAILLLRSALAHKYKFTNASFISLAFFFFPNLMLWTADSRKEAFTIFLCVLCMYCVQKYIMKETSFTEHSHLSAKAYAGSLMSICAVCILMWLGTLIRIYMFVPMAAGVLTSLLLMYRKRRLKRYLGFGLIVIVCSLLIFFFTVNPLLESYHAIAFPDDIGDFGVDFANKVNQIKLLASNRNIIISAANYFLLPYPGSTGIEEISKSTILNIIVSVDMLFWYGCMLLIAAGIFFSAKRKESFLLGILAFLACYIVINILVVENVSDTIYRYRSVIIGPALMFIDRDVIGRLKRHICKPFRRRKESGSTPTSITE